MPESSVLCPHCGAASALPLPALADRLKAVFNPGARDVSFANPALRKEFEAGRIQALCTRCGRKFRHTSTGPPRRPASTADRLRELEALKSAGLITPEEHAAKRREILDDV